MRYATDRGINLIKAFEGFRPHVYLDSAGYRTIGYGHLLKKGEGLAYITEPEAAELLRQDVHTASNAVARLIIPPLNDNQFDALTSFTYNLGAACLQRSTLRARLNRGDYGVAGEFPKWCWAGGRKIKGLMLRRRAEANLFIN